MGLIAANDIEIVEGLFYPGDIVTFTGGFNAGKSPLLRDLAFCISTGTPWCGKAVSQRPVILVAHETSERKFFPDWERLSTHKKVLPPAEPGMFELFLEAGAITTHSTTELLNALIQPKEVRQQWLAAKIATRPNAVVMIDPFDMFFRIDKNKAVDVLEIFHWCRMLKRHYPLVTFVFTFNRRKSPRLSNFKMPSLLDNPREWLQEASGAMEIQSRSDLRVGIDFFGDPDDGIRIFGGAKREEHIEPLLLQSIVVGESATGKPLMAGFEVVSTADIPLDDIFTTKQKEAWDQMETDFTMTDLRLVTSTGTAYRIIARAKGLGLITETAKHAYRKVVP